MWGTDLEESPPISVVVVPFKLKKVLRIFIQVLVMAKGRRSFRPSSVADLVHGGDLLVLQVPMFSGAHSRCLS
jgi:hypothetical protein